MNYVVILLGIVVGLSFVLQAVFLQRAHQLFLPNILISIFVTLIGMGAILLMFNYEKNVGGAMVYISMFTMIMAILFDRVMGQTLPVTKYIAVAIAIVALVVNLL